VPSPDRAGLASTDTYLGVILASCDVIEPNLRQIEVVCRLEGVPEQCCAALVAPAGARASSPSPVLSSRKPRPHPMVDEC
jgi:hypothetical protein